MVGGWGAPAATEQAARRRTAEARAAFAPAEPAATGEAIKPSAPSDSEGEDTGDAPFATETAAAGEATEAAAPSDSEGGGRVNLGCACCCHGGVILLVNAPGIRPELVLQRCECRVCGPVRRGGRQCLHSLNPFGALISRLLDGQLLCFERQGCDWSCAVSIGKT